MSRRQNQKSLLWRKFRASLWLGRRFFQHAFFLTACSPEEAMWVQYYSYIDREHLQYIDISEYKHLSGESKVEGEKCEDKKEKAA